MSTNTHPTPQGTSEPGVPRAAGAPEEGPDPEVRPPRQWAAGVPGILHALDPSLHGMGVARSAKLLLRMNHQHGFDCMSCAWPDPDRRKAAEFCENGAKAVNWEATPLTIHPAFWRDNPVSSLRGRTEHWLGQQGRLVDPVYKAPGSDLYTPVTWEQAFSIVADHLTALDTPDQAVFYTSGRASNEAAFAYQLFVRAFGTNNLPDCSNMCHESTGAAMGDTIGVGKSTVLYDDFEQADLIVIMGQNPGTNHPRMLTALEDAKGKGAQIVAVNPLPEAGLLRYKNPQRPRGILGRGTQLADQFLQVRLGGDMALLQAVSKRVLDAEDAAPGTVLDHAFLAEHTTGLDALRAHLAALDEDEVLRATGLRTEEIDELADRYLAADRVIITWAMGLTQHKKAVPTIKEVINLLLLRGNIGKPGAGASPIRGHSNVQGDRTMGIWEQMPASFLDALDAEFGITVPRHHGLDAVDSIRALADGRAKVLFALGGNLVGAISDTTAAEAAVSRAALTVQVSTKLNRSHAVTGDAALILPCLGRTEIDRQGSGEQFVSVEDSVCAVHASRGAVEPVGPNLLSEVAIVSRLAREVLGRRPQGDGPVDWAAFERDYDTIRDHIAAVVPGCEDYNAKIRRESGFVLPHGPRDSRTFPTSDGKAHLTVNALEAIDLPAGRLLLQTVRAHDQFNTTVYAPNDRYRGIKHGRAVVFVNPDDLADLGLADGDRVDLHGEHTDGVDRVLPGLRVVAYPSARGCAATYFPEANVLVPLDAVAETSNTPVSKAVVVRLERAPEPAVVPAPA
ncbi:FdhF/YdeP family oxidoreductase [Luteimicrobium subarcticum]|uniref:Formate dehydrogenase major subunit n=1 Tax=Luteimicrobium subarcticum TaxID=620910 RepID=A0A2M8WT95_9MICO|nr:FdhF/YdeP family oxidoreductase [Luteimicrobium subarcticum]PJI94076.1 formate dehydrogenase major subunit [Luteimicrobium subarcticum]